MIKRETTKPRACDRWKGGVCLALADQGHLVWCPQARADNASPGVCCHHPMAQVRSRLVQLKRAGVDLKRYGLRLRDPVFVERLYSTFLKARSKRSTTRANTSGRS